MMIKLTIAAAAVLATTGVAGAQMTGGNTISAAPSGMMAKTTVHKNRVVRHKVTHHKTTTTSPGTMGNSM